MSRQFYFALVLLAAAVGACEEQSGPFAPIEPYDEDDAGGEDSGESMGGGAGGPSGGSGSASGGSGGTGGASGGSGGVSGGSGGASGGSGGSGGTTGGSGPPLDHDALSAGCEGMSPDAVYIRGQSKNVRKPDNPHQGIYAGDLAFFIPVLYDVEGQSVPCIVGCAKAVTLDGKILGSSCAIGNSVSSAEVFETVPDLPAWSNLEQKWIIPNLAAQNDLSVIERENTTCGSLYAYPDRPGVLADCFSGDLDQWWDSNDLSKPRDLPFGFNARDLLALGRNGLMLFGDDKVLLVNDVVLWGDAGEVARVLLPDGVKVAAGRASEEGFLMVVQDPSDLTDVRQLFISKTGQLSQRATYPNPEGWSLYTPETNERRPTQSTVLRADGVFFAAQGKTGVFGRVVRFDSDASDPVIVMTESKDLPSDETPFPMHFVEGFVTGG